MKLRNIIFLLPLMFSLHLNQAQALLLCETYIKFDFENDFDMFTTEFWVTNEGGLINTNVNAPSDFGLDSETTNSDQSTVTDDLGFTKEKTTVKSDTSSMTLRCNKSTSGKAVITGSGRGTFGGSEFSLSIPYLGRGSAQGAGTCADPLIQKTKMNLHNDNTGQNYEVNTTITYCQDCWDLPG